MRLSKYEKETIILTSEGDDTVRIYTFNASLKRRLAEYAEKYPHLARLDRWTTEGSVTYVLDKSRVSICLLPPLSEERRRVFVRGKVILQSQGKDFFTWHGKDFFT